MRPKIFSSNYVNLDSKISKSNEMLTRCREFKNGAN